MSRTIYRHRERSDRVNPRLAHFGLKKHKTLIVCLKAINCMCRAPMEGARFGLLQSHRRLRSDVFGQLRIYLVSNAVNGLLL